MIDLERIQTLSASQQLELTRQQTQQLDQFAQLLVDWNQRMNLTAITDPEEILIKHFLDSVLPFSFLDLPQGCRLIDVGTGAGFPAVPLCIWRPDLQATLLDSLNKRLVFLQEVLPACGVRAVLVHSRAEDGGHRADLREQFDVATARAVANLRDLAEYCLPFVKPGGLFCALKGGDADAELADAQAAIRLLGGRVSQSRTYSLPDGSARTLICMEKISQTPTKYPRSPAKMAKSPLR